MSIDHAMTVARLAADFGVSLEEIGDAMRRLDDPVRNRTVAQHVEVVLAETSSGTAGTYRRYWNLLVDAHGDRPVAELTVEHLRGVTRVAEATKTVRANSNGTSLAENCVAALRRVDVMDVSVGACPDECGGHCRDGSFGVADLDELTGGEGDRRTRTCDDAHTFKGGSRGWSQQVEFVFDGEYLGAGRHECLRRPAAGRVEY